MVMGLLRGGMARAHDKYIAGRQKVPMQPRGEADAGGQTLRGSAAGRAETRTAGTSSERVDLRGDLAACRRAGHDAAEITGADGTAEAWTSDTGQPEGRPKTAGGGGGDGNRRHASGGSAER